MKSVAFDEFAGCVPTVDFAYPDEGDEPAPRVRDEWVEAPLVKKCQQRFAVVPSNDVMTMPLLDKRLEVLRYALREAVERMDVVVIHQLAEKAIATRERIGGVEFLAIHRGWILCKSHAQRIVLRMSCNDGRNLRRW